MKEFHIDDVALLRGFNSRDEYSINKLHGLFYKKLYWFARTYLKDKAQAQDAVTDAFLALLNVQEAFEGIGIIRSWLFTRVYWNCLAALRPRAKQKMFKATDEFMDVPDEDSTVEERRIKAEVIHAILQEIEKLPERQKTIIKLYFFEGKTTQEIADHLHMNVKTVHNIRNLLLKSIKNELIRKSLMVLLLGFLLPVQ